MTLRVRPIDSADAGRWCVLRAALWPDDHTAEVSAYFRGELAEPRDAEITPP